MCDSKSCYCVLRNSTISLLYGLLHDDVVICTAPGIHLKPTPSKSSKGARNRNEGGGSLNEWTYSHNDSVAIFKKVSSKRQVNLWMTLDFQGRLDFWSSRAFNRYKSSQRISTVPKSCKDIPEGYYKFVPKAVKGDKAGQFFHYDFILSFILFLFFLVYSGVVLPGVLF